MAEQLLELLERWWRAVEQWRTDRRARRETRAQSDVSMNFDRRRHRTEAQMAAVPALSVPEREVAAELVAGCKEIRRVVLIPDDCWAAPTRGWVLYDRPATPTYRQDPDLWWAVELAAIGRRHERLTQAAWRGVNRCGSWAQEIAEAEREQAAYRELTKSFTGEYHRVEAGVGS